MKTNKSFSRPACSLRGAGLALLMAAAPLSHAGTVWTGPTITYTQPASDPSLAADQDRLTADVWLTRGSSHPMFNAFTETFYNGSTSPQNTEWAFGALADYASLTFDTWANVIGGGGGGGYDYLQDTLPNRPLVLHLVSDDIYLSIEFNDWKQGGGYSYTRSTPEVSLPAPTVGITSPSGGAVFTAPASVPITASASVSSGTVTNVSFFAGANLLGSVHSSPFNYTALSLAAGNYSLTAVATAAGVSATSSVVNITVKPPAPTVSITNPVAGAVFAAPANLKVGAAAAVSLGTVTNVAFFATNAAATNSLGSALSSPFNITSGTLAAGNYSLIAVATAAGISATSSVVNVSVVSPVAVSNAVPAVATGQFSLNYSANVGLTYVVQRSSDLSTWVPLVTNVASSNLVHFAETAVGSGARFYRVVRQPNP